MERVIEKINYPVPTAPKLTRVAAYARVSSGKDAMLHSLSAQVSYYNRTIQNHPGWIFCGVYADEALTGTKDTREQFQRLLADCRTGKVDLILTKSISRFARNTLTLLKTVRELKSLGVDVYFEEQNIHSLSADGELILTILAGYAQEESLSASENQKWRVKQKFLNGQPWRTYMLGYHYDGEQYIIVPEEAVIVKRIYAMFMQGKTTCSIARTLTAEGIPTPGGKQKWSASTVESILKNEKYRGDAILQKTFTVDFLQKKLKPNEGEVPQYYVHNSHPAIIPPEEWNLVQAEMARRKELKQRYSSHSVFASMIFCGECGGYYGSKVWHSTDQYRKVVWQCSDKFKNERKCTTPHLTEMQLQTLFLQAFGKIVTLRESILEDCLLVQKELFDTTEADMLQQALRNDMQLAAEMVRHCIEENALKAQDQTEYLRQYEQYTQHYEKLKKKYDALLLHRQKRKEHQDRLNQFITMLQSQTELPVKFHEDLWLATVDKVTVYHDTVVFTFRGGFEITEEI